MLDDYSSNPFSGIRFFLAGFNQPLLDHVKSKLVSVGAVAVPKYGPKCTHVIVHDLVLGDPICVAAREDGKALVTSLWVDHSLEAGEPVNAASIVYRPPKDRNGIPGAEEFLISLTGYRGPDREDIMTMVSVMGAQFSKAMVANKVTHLICYQFEGEKYDLAKRVESTKIVNRQWLEDCLKTWKILPEERYNRSDYELEIMEAVAKDSEEETEDFAEELIEERNISGHPSLQNEVGEPHDHPPIASKVSSPSRREGLSYNMSAVDVKFLIKEEAKSDQASNCRTRNQVDQQSSRQHRGDSEAEKFSTLSCSKKTPTKSSLPLNVGDNLGNKSGASPKQLVNSGTSKRSPGARKTLPTSSLSLQTAGKPGNSGGRLERSLAEMLFDDVSTSHGEPEKEKTPTRVGVSSSKKLADSGTGKSSRLSLQTVGRKGLAEKVNDDVLTSNLEPNEEKAASACVEAPCVGACLLDKEAPVDMLPQKRKLDALANVSHATPKSQKLNSSTSKRIDASEPTKSTGTPARSKKNPLNIVSHKGDETAKLSSSSTGDEKAAPQNQQESTLSPPATENLEAPKLGSPKLNLDDITGGSVSKPPRKKTVARKTLGSRPKLAQKGSRNGNSFRDVSSVHSVGQTEKKGANSSAAEAVKDVGSKALLKSSNENNDCTGTLDNATEAPLELDLLNEKSFIDELSHLTETRTDEAAITTSPTNTTSKQGVPEAEIGGKKQSLAKQKKGISGTTKKKTVVDASKAPDDADRPERGKSNEEAVLGKERAVSAVGKKRCGTLVLKESEAPVEVGKENEGIVGNDQGTSKKAGKLNGNLGGKKRRGTLQLNNPKSPVEVENENDPILDGHEDESVGEKDPEKENNLLTANDKGTSKGGKRAGSLTGKKRRDTLVLNKSNETTGDEGKENEPILDGDDDEGKTIGGKGKKFGGKSNLTVRKRDDRAVNRDPLSIQGNLNGANREPAWFILSGHKLQRKEFQQLIKGLKGKLCRDCHQWSYQATHFVVPDPIKRTEKFFAAAASGRWILKTDYLTASSQAGKFLPEEPYEWHKKGLNEDGAINLEAPRKWRLLREKTGHGAFYGMRIIIYGECIAPPLDTLKRVVKAGDGTILATSPPYSRFLKSGVDFAIVSPGMPRVDIWVQEFIRHEIPCVLADYLVEYVCKPGYSLERHVQYNTHEWAAKSLSRLLSLSEETIVDPATPDGQVSDDLACQVCGSSDRGEVMLICGDESGSHGCGIGTHIDCCDPPFDDVPEGDWFCPKCNITKASSDSI